MRVKAVTSLPFMVNTAGAAESGVLHSVRDL